MDGFGTPLTSGNIQYVFAFIILVLGGVVVYQNRQITELRKGFDALQEERVKDAKETTDKVTIPLSSISQTMTLIYDKLRVSKEQ